MKTSLYLVVVTLFIFISIDLNSQSCLPDGITFSSQQDIDDFSSNYPGCTMIEGDVLIEESTSSNITNLNGLSQLTSIGGYLRINQNLQLSNLTGLNNLTSIGGYLRIAFNGTLQSMTGLDNLTSIGGFLYIFTNPTLTSLAGLDNLTSVGGYLVIGHNESLETLAGIDNLTSIGGDLWISENPVLSTLTGIMNIDPTTIESQLNNYDDLTIADNPSLSECEVQSICDFLALPDKTTEIHSNMTGCNSELEIRVVCDPNLACLPDGIIFSSQEEIDDFPNNYPECTVIEGYVRINESISGNITNLSGLSQLISIGSYLIIDSNDELNTLTGLDNLSSIGKHIFIHNNSTLNTLTGLDNLSTIEGYLYIRNNAALSSLTGLDNVTSIGSFLSILSNPALSSLTGLNNLTAIGGYLLIEDNAELSSLTGIQNIEPSSLESNHTSHEDLELINNPKLSECEVQSICDFLTLADRTSGIYGNMTGCNSETEIITSCVVSSVAYDPEFAKINIYPNPTKYDLIIDFSESRFLEAKITLFNVSGKRLLELEKAANDNFLNINSEDLNSGMYVVRISSNEYGSVYRKVFIEK